MSDNDFSYEAPSTSPGQFGTFDEEEPLLQGGATQEFLFRTLVFPQCHQEVPLWQLVTNASKALRLILSPAMLYGNDRV